MKMVKVDPSSEKVIETAEERKIRGRKAFRAFIKRALEQRKDLQNSIYEWNEEMERKYGKK